MDQRSDGAGNMVGAVSCWWFGGRGFGERLGFGGVCILGRLVGSRRNGRRGASNSLMWVHPHSIACSAMGHRWHPCLALFCCTGSVCASIVRSRCMKHALPPPPKHTCPQLLYVVYPYPNKIRYVFLCFFSPMRGIILSFFTIIFNLFLALL